MIYVEAPNDLPDMTGKVSVFLAGGIMGCPDFQAEICEKVKGLSNLVVLNPRRKDFPMQDPFAAGAQIEWEFNMLRKATFIIFWFPKETLCPIVLFELGAHSMTKKPLVIGCHPEYARKQDVTNQMALVRPGLPIFDNLDDMVEGIKFWQGQLR